MEKHKFKGHEIEHWLQARIDGDDDTRWEAVDAIRHLCGPESSVPLLLDSLQNDRYWRARGLAAHALFDLAIDRDAGLDWDRVIPILNSAADDPSDCVREQIAEIMSVLNHSDTRDM